MKKISIYLYALALVVLAFACDDKFDPAPNYVPGSEDFSVTANSTTIAASATDSVTEVLKLTWNDPQYSVGLENSIFTIKVGKTGDNFVKSYTKTIEGALTGALLGKELNGMAMGLGGEVGEAIALDVTVTASHANLNEPIVSNVLQIDVTPFVDLGIAASSEDIVLTKAQASETALELSWTTAFAGLNVVKSYELQFAQAGTDFADPIVESVTGFTKTYTHAEMNGMALSYGIAPNQEGAIEFRIRATNELGQEIFSNVASVNVTAYATSFPPIYGMGEALKGWGPWPGNAVELLGTDYKKYETVAYFTNDKAFRFFEQLDWGPTSYNYPYFTTVDPLFVNANDGDSNLKFVGTTGWYKINVDLLGKTVEMEAASEPVLYMVGAGVNGWDWDDPVQMTYVRNGVFKATTTFTNNETFRFFGQADWGPVSYNYPYFTTVDPLFVNGNDGDSNLRYTGTTGPQTVTVDLINKVVYVGDFPATLYATGAALNGWNWTDHVTFTTISAGLYEATATFTQGEAFRFFAQADWGPTSYNYPHFSSVDLDFENANDGDSNLRYVGTTGSRKVTVNLLTKTVTLQ